MYVVLEGGSERKRRENKREGRRKEEGESRGGGSVLICFLDNLCLDLFLDNLLFRCLEGSSFFFIALSCRVLVAAVSYYYYYYSRYCYYAEVVRLQLV